MKNILIISSLILSLNVLGGNLNSNPRPRQEQKRSACSGPNCRIQPRVVQKVIVVKPDYSKQQENNFFKKAREKKNRF